MQTPLSLSFLDPVQLDSKVNFKFISSSKLVEGQRKLDVQQLFLRPKAFACAGLRTDPEVDNNPVN